MKKLRKFLTIDWLAAVLLWVGNYVLIYQKSWISFAIFALSNLIWFGYWLKKREWAAMVLTSTFFFQDILGIIEWLK